MRMDDVTATAIASAVATAAWHSVEASSDPVQAVHLKGDGGIEIRLELVLETCCSKLEC